MSDLAEQLKALLGYGKDVAQGASNAIAGNVAGPVDAISWGLRKAGLGNFIGSAPVGGSDWMAQRGITRQPTNALAGGAGETLGLIAPMTAAAKAPQIASGLLKMGENALAPATMNRQMGAIVYHGSPHSFDAFDMGKIGTGEGAQAYGHGLYFADNPEVSRSYMRAGMNPRDALKTMDPTLAPLSEAADAFKVKGLGEDAIYAAMKKQFPSSSAMEIHNAISLPRPNLYKVDLPDEHIAKMLDWDKPLSQQSPEAAASLEKALKSDGWDNYLKAVKAHDAGNPRAMKDAGYGLFDYPGSAGGIVEMLKNEMGPAKATALLQRHGIPGIKYLDQGSRGAGDGTRNYVLFDDKIPKILERNGQSLADQLRDKLK